MASQVLRLVAQAAQPCGLIDQRDGGSDSKTAVTFFGNGLMRFFWYGSNARHGSIICAL
jgi:hypothetical protein